MDSKILRSLQNESSGQAGMISRTIRLPYTLDKAIRDFADENQIKNSVILRAIVGAGWAVLKGIEE